MTKLKQTLSRQARKELYTRLAVRLVLACVVVWCVVAHFGDLMSLLLPFLLAYLLAKALNVVVNRISLRLAVPRHILSFLCVSAMVAAIGVVIYLVARRLVNEGTQLLSSWDDIRSSLTNGITSISQALSSLAGRDQAEFQSDLIGAIQSALTWLNERIAAWSPPVMEQAGNAVERMFSFFLSCVMFFVACFYFTAEFPTLKEQLWNRLPKRLRSGGNKLRAAVGVAAGGYLKAQLILTCLVMLILLIAFLLYGQRYAVLLSVLIAIVDFLPIFGCGTVLVPWAVIALLSGNLSQCVFLLGVWVFLFVFRKVAEPKIVGNQTGLSTLVSLMCIYVGMKIDGVFGMIVAPIICLVLRSLQQAGAFDAVFSDLRLLWRDLRELMQKPQSELENF